MTIISQKNAEFHILKHFFFFMTILIHLGTNATLNHDMRYWNLPNIEPIENALSI